VKDLSFHLQNPGAYEPKGSEMPSAKPKARCLKHHAESAAALSGSVNGRLKAS
jgi:hypothetical protein